MKLKITGTKDLPVYNGEEGFKIRSGSVVQVISGDSNVGDIVYKTKYSAKPFISIICNKDSKDAGVAWGSAISSYRFKVLVGVTLDSYPEFKDKVKVTLNLLHQQFEED